ncbi:MAG: hypothetical protein KF730_16100 [Sphingomonas sp.]|uniref:hypothetical protein n=1 Tax=Sphingomonas sp. TaxID=28214 RepID=UPI0025D83C84|nr:hypothetical protein [Sphingomonas sp.]MBX3566083.1 hypothetical protein [Sphingomonas sp.]
MKWSLLALALWAAPALAQDYPLTAEHWEPGGLARFVDKDGRKAVLLGPGDGNLKGGEATLKGVKFSTGVLEYDMLASGARDFAGAFFRADEAGNGELYYIRPHQNGNPDADQYTPFVNGSWAWQIFSDEGFTSKVKFNIGRWMHVRIDVYRDSALVTVDGAEALAVPDLKSDTRDGMLGVTAAGGTYFANFKVTPIADYADPRPAPAVAPLPAGSVRTWRVSTAMPEEAALARTAKRDWAGMTSVPVAVETNGIANLSRAGPDGDAGHSYVARFIADSGKAQSVKMDFGFSDSVHVYLNGRLLYAGSDKQASRDYRFLGIVGFWDSLFLPLTAGANEVVFVVTDGTNGGTAAAARFDAAAGLSFR